MVRGGNGSIDTADIKISTRTIVGTGTVCEEDKNSEFSKLICGKIIQINSTQITRLTYFGNAVIRVMHIYGCK